MLRKTCYPSFESQTASHVDFNSHNSTSSIRRQRRINIFLTTHHPDSDGLGAGDVVRVFTEFQDRTVLVDLHEVAEMDSWGIALFMEAMQRVSAGGGNLVLFGIGGKLRQVFETAKLDQFFEICSTREEALSRGDTGVLPALSERHSADPTEAMESMQARSVAPTPVGLLS